MRDRAYGDKSDPRHPIFVDEVARLFEIVHPEGGQ
jgi:hypothetical protein